MARVSILKKGLLLVFVPFALNLIWFGLFFLSVQRCSSWVENMGQNSQTLMMLSQSIAAMNRTFIVGDEYLISGDNPSKKEQMVSEAQSLLASLARLKGMTKNDVLISDLTEDLSNKFTALETNLKSLSLRPDPMAIDYERELPVKQFYATAADTTKILKALGARDQAFRQSLAAEELELDKTKIIARVGLSLNILIALLAALLVQRDIVKRILMLARKARSLSAKKFETFVLDGDDELNELDRALVVANTELREGALFKRAFMNLMANNIQTPLQRCLQDVQEVGRTDAAFQEKAMLKQLRAFETSTVNCSNLIDDMLLLENLDYGELVLNISPTSVGEVIDSAIDLLRSLILRKNISIVNTVATEIIAIDKNRISQVITNLLSNAIKFSPDNSTIKIESHSDSRRLRISITDSGAGIDKKTRANLFKKFYQSEDGKKAGGSGLGLAISKLIVEAHHGLIGVDSSPSGSSVFWFELPKDIDI